MQYLHQVHRLGGLDRRYLANVDPDLCARVAVGLGLEPPAPSEILSLPAVRRALLAGGLQLVLVAATGGQLPDGTQVQRTFLTARSVEFDALLLAASPAAAPDALTALVGAGPGVVVAADPLEVVEEIQLLLRGHRVWQRFVQLEG